MRSNKSNNNAKTSKDIKKQSVPLVERGYYPVSDAPRPSPDNVKLPKGSGATKPGK